MARGVTFIATAIQITPWQVQRNLERLERNINGSGGAAATGIVDAGDYYTATDVEGALQEVWVEATTATSDVFTDTNDYYTTDAVGPAFDALGVQIGGLTDTTFTFAENNVLADDAAVYPSLEALDLKWGDLASTTVGEGAALVSINDAASVFTATTVEGALQELAGAGGSQVDLIFTAATELTIATGAITAIQAVHTVDTEGDAGTDDLDTISGLAAEEMVLFRAEDATRDVVFKHGTGNIFCPGGVDITLAELTDWVLVMGDGTNVIVIAASRLSDPDTTHRTGSGADHANVATNTTHSTGDGSDHANVATNTTHASSAGTDHSDVGLNNTHRTGDGSDHADVAANTTLVNELGVEETDDTLQAKRIAKAVWDHGAGLATASSPFTFGPTLPDNAVVTRVWYHVVTTFTSGTDAAVIGIGIVTDDADGLVTPAAISAATDWDAGNHEGIQDGTVAAFATQTTAARLFEGTIITEDTTAGKVIVYAEYVVTE